MAKVLHVVVAGEVGGAERMLVDLARDPRDAHTIALFTPSARLRALFRDAGLVVVDRGPVRESPAHYLVRTLGPWDRRFLDRVIADVRPSIVHLHTFASQVLGTRAARRASLPIVRTEHSSRVFDDPSCWPFSRWSLARADASIAISGHIRDVAAAKAPWARAKLSVVPNGVDVTRFAPRTHDAPSDRTADGSADATAIVRYVALGRLEPRKGLDIAFEAVARVPHAHLDVVGDGPSRDALVALAGRFGIADRVRFEGFHEDVRPFVARADALLSAARSEGLGIALLEGMAMGKPVVALPTGGIPEIVQDGTSGWLARSSSPETLAEAMRAAAKSGAERLRRGAAARDFVVARYSLDAMRDGYHAVYARLTHADGAKQHVQTAH